MNSFRSPEEFADRYIGRHKSFIAPLTVAADERTIFTRAKGTRLWDAKGKEYLDFNASVGTSALGHGHPRISEMQERQRKILDFVEGTTFYYCFKVEVAGKTYEISPAALAEKLLSIMFPADARLGTSKSRCVFGLGGVDAVNIAVKLCLKANPGKYHFINFDRAFHGRYGYALDLNASKPIQRQDFPSSGIVVHTLPYPDSHESFLRALECLNTLPSRNVNAVIMEPLQGEGGFRWPEQKYKDDLLTLLAEEGIRIVFDEIQSGLGRTGKWFAYQHGRTKPDMVICGKPLGGGDVPISAVGYRRDMFDYRDDDVLETGWHSGTFPMYPKSVASAIMFLEIMEEEGLVKNAMDMGWRLRRVLQEYASDGEENVNYCRRTGFGLMQGLEFLKFDQKPDHLRRNTVLKRLRDAKPVGILTLPAGIDTLNPVIRFEPCLVVTQEEIQYLDHILAGVLS